MSNIVKQPCDEGVIRSAPEGTPCSRAVGSWILAATILGSSMAFIDGTVVNVALPVLQVELNATVVDVQWVVEAYALMLASLLLVGGSMGDRFGRRRIFATGVTIFAVASVWCGLAASADELIIARGAQGVGGALLVPGSLAILSASFSQEQRGRAIGTWSGFTAITAAMGPVLGGWLVDGFSWRWIFFINVPVAVVVLGILFSRVPETRDEAQPVSLDWWGALLVTVGLGAIVYGLIESANLGIDHPLVIGSVVGGAAGLLLFVLVESRTLAPMMPLTLFRSRTFTGANVAALLLYSALGGALFFVPFNLILVQGYSATAAGGAFLPLILIIFLLSRWAGGLVHRYGARLPLMIGPAIAAGGYILLARPEIGGSYWTTFFPAVTVLGLGMAISVAPLTTTVMNAVEVRHSGIASGINNAASRTAGLLSIAILGILILAAFNRELDDQMASLDLPAEARQVLDDQRTRLAAAEVRPGLSPDVTAALEQAIALSFVKGFRLVMFIAASLALGSAFAAGLTIKREKE